MPKRANALGLTAGDAIPAVSSPSISPDNGRIIRFPAPPPRRVTNRPTPPPILRECPYCGAAFEDRTRRANTLYCRASCRVMMSRVKARRGIAALASVSAVPEERIQDVYDAKGMMEIERLLAAFGLAWDTARKEWRK